VKTMRLQDFCSAFFRLHPVAF